MLCALAFACILHRPGLQAWGDAIPGQGDAIRAHWSAWVVAAEFPRWTLHTTYAGFPDGVHLLALPPISLMLVAPITLLLGPSLGLVALLIFHTVLSVCSASFLGQSLGARRNASLAAGLLLAAAPILGESLRSGIYEYQTVGWIALLIGALIRACKGSLGWGVASGILYIVTLLECGYYGSAMALVVPIVVGTQLKSKRGLVSASFAALTVGLLAWMCSIVLGPVLEGMLSSTTGEVGTPPPPNVNPVETQPMDNGDARRLSFAEIGAALPFVGWDDPMNGHPMPYHASPSLLLWIAAISGLVFRLRTLWWLGLSALLLLLLAMGSPLMNWWADGLLGQHVGIPKRLLGPINVLLCGMAALGLDSILDRWIKAQWHQKASLVFGFLAAGLSAHGNGLWTDYPLLWTPKDPAFLSELQNIPSKQAIVVLPQEQPEGPNKLDHQPLMANDPSFANPQARLWWQTRWDRPSRHYSHLGTLTPTSNTPLRIDGPVSNGGQSLLDPQEIESLREKGLSALVIDHGQFPGNNPQALSAQIQRIGGRCQYFEDWSGVTVCSFSEAE